MKESEDIILEIGMVLNDKWAILEFIGKGGMGEVYRAHQLNLKRDVAIKVISQECLESFDGEAEEIEGAIERFRQEVQTMAQVRHKNILQIYDYGSASVRKNDEDIVMEFISGATLRFTMSEAVFYQEADLSRDWVRDYFLPVLDGVQALHEAGIIHRDLKPENVLLDGKTPKIADFGLSRSSNMKPVTRSVAVMGSPAYMSLEHFVDFRKADQKADIYSLGKILYEAIAGQATSKTIPFKSSSLRNTDSPFHRKLDRIIQEATAEEREKRTQSVERLRTAIMDATDNSKSKNVSDASLLAGYLSAFGHRKWIWGGVVVAIVSLILVSAMYLSHLKAERQTQQTLLNVPEISEPRASQSPPPTAPGRQPSLAKETSNQGQSRDSCTGYDIKQSETQCQW